MAVGADAVSQVVVVRTCDLRSLAITDPEL
jgi:hypothetical protein